MSEETELIEIQRILFLVLERLDLLIIVLEKHDQDRNIPTHSKNTYNV